MKNNIENFTIKSKKDDLNLSLIKVTPKDKKLKGILQVAHGMSEHKERYLPFLDYMSSLGYVCIINDHRGHGKSVKSIEDLGYFYDNGADALVEDLHQITEVIKEEYPKLPVYLFGHSMGSLAIRAYIKKYDYEVDGLIVCGCPSDNKGSRIGKKISEVLSLIKGDHYRSKFIDKLVTGVFNSKIKDSTSNNDWICTDKKIVKDFDKDPLCGFTFTVNGFCSLFDLMNKVYSKKGWELINDKLPIWFISGEEDPCMGSKKKFLNAVNLLKEVGYKNVSYKIYSKMRHEILNEKDREKVFKDISDKIEEWESHLKNK